MTKHRNKLIKNIYYMLCYAYTPLKRDEYKEIEVEEFDNIQNLFAAILSKGLGKQLKQGLYREYLTQQDDLPVLRGKIDMVGTIKNRLAKRQVLSVEYDELTENNQLNQILKSTAMLLLRHGNVESQYKDSLKKEMLLFSNVDLIDPRRIRWNEVLFNKSNDSYRMLIGICELVIKGLLLTTENGELRLASFIVDENVMCRLYEKFLLEYYTKEWPQLEASASHVPWALDDENRAMLPVMITDVTLERGNEVLIIEAKYYTHTTQERYGGSHTIYSNNLYQLFTYVKNRSSNFGSEPHKVNGILLYARTEDQIQPDGDYQMSGNKISVKTLDLNRDFSEIAAQLDSIAKDNFTFNQEVSKNLQEQAV